MTIQLLVLAVTALLAFEAPARQDRSQDDSLRIGQESARWSIANTNRSSVLRPRRSVERRSLLEPTAFVLAFHAIGMGLLVSMDPEETGFEPMHVRNWANGMTNLPIWDDDSNITNYILHPLWGSETYLQARRAHHSPFRSFLFSTAASVMWEYGFESWAEHPSQQDLLFTSTVGSVLGEARHHARLALINQDAAWAAVLLILLDPLGTLVAHSTRLVGNVSKSISTALSPEISFAPAIAGGVGDQIGLQLIVPL